MSIIEKAEIKRNKKMTMSAEQENKFTTLIADIGSHTKEGAVIIFERKPEKNGFALEGMFLSHNVSKSDFFCAVAKSLGIDARNAAMLIAADHVDSK